MDESYAPDPGWPALSAGTALGQVTGVQVDGRGGVYVLHRGSPPVLHVGPDGRLIEAWGEELAQGGGHFLRLDPAGDMWITDTTRHQVLHFTPDGRLVGALGRERQAGLAPDQFDQPTDLAFLPSGELFVADGYGNARIKKYAASGDLLAIWGTPGRSPGEFDTPHAVCLDSTGRLYVSDRANSRIQVFSPDGAFLEEWRGFPYVDGLAAGPDDSIFLATGRANGILRVSTLEFEGDPPDRMPIVLESYGNRYATHAELVNHVMPPPGTLNMAHGISVDANGDVYVAEVRARRAQRLVRQTPFVQQQVI